MRTFWGFHPSASASAVSAKFLGSPQDRPCLGIAGVANQLVVADTRRRARRFIGRKYGHDRANIASPGSEREMLAEGPVDTERIGNVATISYEKTPPIKPPDTTGVVTPRDPRAEPKLLRGKRPLRLRRSLPLRGSTHQHARGLGLLKKGERGVIWAPRMTERRRDFIGTHRKTNFSGN